MNLKRLSLPKLNHGATDGLQRVTQRRKGESFDESCVKVLFIFLAFPHKFPHQILTCVCGKFTHTHTIPLRKGTVPSYKKVYTLYLSIAFYEQVLKCSVSILKYLAIQNSAKYILITTLVCFIFSTRYVKVLLYS